MPATRILYEALNTPLLPLVPSTAVRILDIGCGTGVLGECLNREKNRHVVGITYSEQEASLASKKLAEVHCTDINNFDFECLGKFDCVILSHILEHLYFPNVILERLKCILGPESTVIVALPNVVWWKQRFQFLIGNWRYQDWGVLDRTHFRFFDRRSSAELLTDAGYEIIQRISDGPFPLLKPIRKYIGPWTGKIDRFTSELMPGLFAMQFVYQARVKK